MLIKRALPMTGQVSAKLIRGSIDPPQGWRLKNILRKHFIKGWLAYHFAAPLAQKMGVMTAVAKLSAVHIKADGTHVDYGVLSYRLVTDAFVNFLVDQFQTETAEVGDLKFHDSGVGTTAENAGDTDIETTDGESRVTGTQVEGASANIYRSVGTIAYTTTKAITEHGLFTIVTGGTLVDRSVFAAINVTNGDSIQFTYELTLASGG